MHLSTRVGSDALTLFSPDTMPGTGFVRCVHSVGAPLKPGQADVPWPSDHVRYVSHFPEERMVWSYGSGHVDRTEVALRLASVVARDHGWLAEHMAIVKVASPENRIHYLAAAFPSAGGETTLAMLEPVIPGWQIELVGDDVAWLRFGPLASPLRVSGVRATRGCMCRDSCSAFVVESGPGPSRRAGVDHPAAQRIAASTRLRRPRSPDRPPALHRRDSGRRTAGARASRGGLPASAGAGTARPSHAQPCHGERPAEPPPGDDARR